MAKNDFVHLHFHTQYSLLDGACRIKDAVAKAKRLGMPGLAISDHGVMFGAVEHYKTCKKEGIKPIIGCEVYTTPHSMHERKRNVDGSLSNHLLLLAKNETGYYNLARMCSLGHLEGYYYKPRIDRELLAANAEGIVGTTTCLKGEIPEMIVRDQFDAAVQRAGEYAEIFAKGDYYVELQDHGIKEQKKANKGLIELARKLDLPIIATNDVHYVEQADSKAHEVLLCLQTQTTMNDPNRLKYGTDQFYMKSPDEMAALFGDIPGALSNTVEILEKCNLEMKLGDEADLHFPVYELPEGFATDKDYLIHVSKEGLAKKYKVADFDTSSDELAKQIKERFYHELGVIERTGFINYFLVVWDFIAWAKTQNIPVGPGRGSGAGSLIAYAMGITEVDPLRYSLIFERFLNPERVSPPDFDIDFCQYRRGEVIEYVKDKYGRENCAQIITFGTLGAKMVIRDVARVLEIPLGEADKLAKLIPETPGMTLTKAEKENPDFAKAIKVDPNAREIMKYARVLEGLPRQQGVHAAGVVIGDKPLNQLIPLCRDKDKQTVTQYEMKPLEETGLLKMDFLGLKTLTVVQEAVDNIKESQGIEIDIATIPMEDEATFDLLNRGDTDAVFQVESKGMKEWLRKFQLARFEDLIAMIALYRPGPMDMLPDFIGRRHGTVKIEYDHPLLESILDETYGVMIYQEQVQQASASLAGFTLAQGDMLRRAMGKKVPEIMAAERQKFIDGCVAANKINPKLAGKIFDNIEKFAGYGFNKSHSTAYAVIAWQTAYLKAHYPVEFMAAVCSCDMGNPDKLAGFIDSAQKMGIEVLPPSVNAGGERFKPEGDSIRFGMAGIKGVGGEAVRAYVAEREANGPFAGLTDFCMRLDGSVANKRVLEALIKCGAFDFAGMYRSTLFHHIDFAMQRASATQKDNAAGQFSMFDMLSGEGGDQEAERDVFPRQEAWPNMEMLKHEKDLIGFYITGHPLDEWDWEAEHIKQINLAAFEETAEKGSQVRVVGLVTQCRKLFTKKTQEPMAAFSLEGRKGVIDCVMFPASYRDFGQHIFDDNPVVIVGEVAKDEEGKLFASEAYPLSEANRIFIKKVTLHIDAEAFNEQQLEQVKNIISEHPGQTAIIVEMAFPSGHKVRMSTDEDLRVEVTGSLVNALSGRLGEDRVVVDIPKKPGIREQQKRTWGNGR